MTVATYVYRCRAHGRVEVVKPMAESGRGEACPSCAAAMVKDFTAHGIIMRPTGYNLRPGDKDYANFARPWELGEVREPDATSRLSAGATVSSRLERTPPRFDDDKVKVFRDAARAHYNAVTGRHEW